MGIQVNLVSPRQKILRWSILIPDMSQPLFSVGQEVTVFVKTKDENFIAEGTVIERLLFHHLSSDAEEWCYRVEYIYSIALAKPNLPKSEWHFERNISSIKHID